MYYKVSVGEQVCIFDGLKYLYGFFCGRFPHYQTTYSSFKIFKKWWRECRKQGTRLNAFQLYEETCSITLYQYLWQIHQLNVTDGPRSASLPQSADSILTAPHNSL